MSDSVSNIPIISNGTIIGRGEIVDEILTVEFGQGIAVNFVDYIKMGLMTGFEMKAVHAEASPVIQTTEIHIEGVNHG